MQSGCRDAHFPSAPCLHDGMHAPLAAAGSRMPQGCIQPQDRLHTGCKPSACHIYACAAWNAGNAARMMQSAGRGRLEARTTQAERLAGWPAPISGAQNAAWPAAQDNGTRHLQSSMPPCRECRAAVEVPISQAHHACMTRHARTARSGREQNAAGLRPATGSAPYWMPALCVSHLCLHRKECRECGSHDAERRQRSPRGPHHTSGATRWMAGANQRRPECRMASSTTTTSTSSTTTDATTALATAASAANAVTDSCCNLHHLYVLPGQSQTQRR